MNSVMKRIVLFILLGWVVFSTQSVFADSNPDGKNYCFLFILDAVEPSLLKEMMAKGELPTIKKYIYDRGLWVANATTVFPSVTSPAVSTIISGNFPGKHKMVGFQWFNRVTGGFKSYIGTDVLEYDADLAENTKTIFDYFDKTDIASFAVIAGSLNGTNKSLVGSALNPFQRWDPLIYIYYTDLLHKVGLGQGVAHFMALYEWRFEYDAYTRGTDDEKAREVIRKFDHQLNKIITMLKARGIFNKTYLVLCSDHGFPPKKKNFYIDKKLSALGMRKRLISYNLGSSHFPLTLERWDSFLSVSDDLRKYNVIVGCNAGGFAQLYFVKNGGYNRENKFDPMMWIREVLYSDLTKLYLGPEKGYVNMIEYLKNLEGVDFFIVRENYFFAPAECRVRIVSKRGMATIVRRGGDAHNQVYKYTVLKGEDPLRFGSHPETKKLMDGKFHSGKQWQLASYAYEYPDACVQLTQILDTTRSGSVLISCAKDWGVNSKNVCKHGGYSHEEMRPTMCISGPGIIKQTIPTARLADITPSILYLLNKNVSPDSFDGDIIPELKDAVKRREEQKGNISVEQSGK